MAELKMRIGQRLDTIGPSLSNGPGWRICVWTQGCSIRCTEKCLSPHLLSPNGGFLYSVEDIVERVLECREEYRCFDIIGVTLLGGEPTDQTEASSALLKAVRDNDFDTMLYTGREYDEMKKEERFKDILALTDVLVDGPFVPELHDGTIPWRGSTNQQIRCLSEKYDIKTLMDFYDRQKKAFVIRWLPDGTESLDGTQDREINWESTSDPKDI